MDCPALVRTGLEDSLYWGGRADVCFFPLHRRTVSATLCFSTCALLKSETEHPLLLMVKRISFLSLLFSHLFDPDPNQPNTPSYCDPQNPGTCNKNEFLATNNAGQLKYGLHESYDYYDKVNKKSRGFVFLIFFSAVLLSRAQQGSVHRRPEP